jgi:DNA-3-methyladenine glycosylase
VRPGDALIPPAFFLRPVAEVARDLLGQQLSHGEVLLRITEVEAYGGPGDSASHARSGRTARNAPMWEAGGLAYIFLCYGMHLLLNVVAGPAGEASAVLIRACEPLGGLEILRARRGGLEGPVLLTGPGKVAQALGLDRSFNGHPLLEPGGLELRAGEPPGAIRVGTRVGIDYAEPGDREALLRFAVADSPWVTHRAALRPIA